MASLIAPDGNLIIGTVDDIKACIAVISNQDISRNPDGTFDFEYAGGTDVNWDGQETRKNTAGHRLFWDENYNIWSEDQLELVEDVAE